MKQTQTQMQTFYFGLYSFNGDEYVAEHPLVPDEFVRYLHMRVIAPLKWGRGKGIVTGVVRGAMMNKHGNYIYLVECEVTRKLTKCGRPLETHETEQSREAEEERRAAGSVQVIPANRIGRSRRYNQVAGNGDSV